MKFIKDGPSIPNELLWAADQGRIVVFCGAGVSIAKAGLPSFLGLAEDVINKLGAPDDHVAKKLLNESWDIQKRTGVNVIPADRIFGLLDRDFGENLERAVSNAIKPKENVNLSAHKAILDLATTQTGITKLVTTNFDLLFEDCIPDITKWMPPQLPDPSATSEFEGIVYLHGKVNKEYSRAEGGGLILSTAEFGRAYLSEAWATKFIKSLVRRYVVLFVGYSADDPPVQYLLEAFNKSGDRIQGAYAFQAGSDESAKARWSDKGVTAMPYSEKNEHEALWTTINLWSKRTKNRDEWYKDKIKMASTSPEKMEAYERGQIAHIVSDTYGARMFARNQETPHANWLLVFDTHRRFDAPKSFRSKNTEIDLDAYDLFHLDSDPAPQLQEENSTKQREIPHDCWSAFELSHGDRLELSDRSLPIFRSNNRNHTQSLPPRLRLLGFWIGKVSGHQTTLWWATKGGSLHPETRWEIERELEKVDPTESKNLNQEWRYLFEEWDLGDRDVMMLRHQLKDIVVRDGWCSGSARRFGEYLRPYISTRSYHSHSNLPPSQNSKETTDFVRPRVCYPTFASEIEIPKKSLLTVCIELRFNLELASRLESEVHDYDFISIDSIFNFEESSLVHHTRYEGLNGAIRGYIDTFESLLSHSAKDAKLESLSWQTGDQIFSRIMIWSLQFEALNTDSEVRKVLMKLPSDFFWGGRAQLDLLTVIAKRWPKLTSDTRNDIESLIIEGPKPFSDEGKESYARRKSYQILTRLTWLHQQDLKLNVNLEELEKKLTLHLPDWTRDLAKDIDESINNKVGWIETQPEYSSLLGIPVKDIVEKAKSVSGRTKDFLIEKAPFQGLSDEKPIKAFSALRSSAKKNHIPSSYWRVFLESEARINDSPRFISHIATTLNSFPTENKVDFYLSFSRWLSRVSKRLEKIDPSLFQETLQKSVDSLENQRAIGKSAILRANNAPDWSTSAINSVPGNIAEILIKSELVTRLADDEAFPTEWLKTSSKLLALPGESSIYALVIYSLHLRWLFFREPQWAKDNILISLSSTEDNRRQAFWTGFLWSRKPIRSELIAEIKPFFKQLIQEIEKSNIESLSGALLGCWLREEQSLSSRELRELILISKEELRKAMLCRLKNWCDSDLGNGRGKIASLLPDFLRDVWPLQTSIRSSEITINLVSLILKSPNLIPQTVDILIPLISKITHKKHIHFHEFHSEPNACTLHPFQTLKILETILPDDIIYWPYDFDSILKSALAADQNIESSEHYIELKRKWDSR